VGKKVLIDPRLADYYESDVITLTWSVDQRQRNVCKVKELSLTKTTFPFLTFQGLLKT